MQIKTTMRYYLPIKVTEMEKTDHMKYQGCGTTGVLIPCCVFSILATFERRLALPVASGWNTMDHTGAIDTEDEVGPLAHLAPSPQSEAVAHEFQELSLQSSQNLPPLNERKNGSVVFWESGLQSPLLTQSVSMVKFLIYGLCV
ncbi:myocardin-related transcription factor B isoform X5 [Papio anubis]|nr:myocardin-related transcription factor B isoform X5 [Papio anubis]